MLAKAKLRLGRREIDGMRGHARQDGVRLVEKAELGEPPHPPGGGITARQACLRALLLQQPSGPRNVVPAMLDAARAYATLFEIRHALEEVFGAYQEPVFF